MPRSVGRSLDEVIARLNGYLLGWIGFFRVCTEVAAQTLGALDARIRRRLRAVKLAQWKQKRFIARHLIALGVRPQTAWRNVYGGRKSIWALSHAPAQARGD